MSSNLRAKLCRELVQSEHDAIVHPAREADRLGDVPPAEAMRLISRHARIAHPRLLELVGRQPVGVTLGHVVGELFSLIRHAAFDRLIRVERSYRATVLGLKHGLDVARMLQRVMIVDADLAFARWCERVLVERQALIENAEFAFGWFAAHREIAVRSGLRLALEDVEPARAGA